jgi:hypothetical protein
MMEELLKTLLHQARMEQAVAMQRLDSGLHIFVYPLRDGVIIALGIAPDRPLPARDLLRKRSSNLMRYGVWLPAMFNDGSLYVLRRVTGQDDEASLLTEATLTLAEELLQ